MNLPRATAKRAALVLFVLAIMLIQPAQAQTFSVIHSFTGGGDGENPTAGLAMDGAGTFYGTAGVAFKLKNSGNGWALTPLYNFGPNTTGEIVVGPAGGLYGTNPEGGYFGGLCSEYGCGLVFNLQPPSTACASVLCNWNETTLYTFTEYGEAFPNNGIVFDPTGNLYGTTLFNTVFELSPSSGGWTFNIIYSFNGMDGATPYSGLIRDSSGYLYGTTAADGPYGGGTVYRLTRSGSEWTIDLLYAFQDGSDGAGPIGGLVFDNQGNLYGTTTAGGSGGAGTVFKLAPSNGLWTLTTLYSFSGMAGTGSYASLAIDASGNLYGTTYREGANGYGSVFKLTSSGGSWTYTDLHDFTAYDGCYPSGNITLDAQDNLYSTASACGEYQHGVVWEIMQ
ncbi:MAG: choice-of-anchor tandem repeat GloVer-containing protein [Candidatus Korobacteraceae bacterium]|jgi:uncharacterized repeat protein (TIGR03803 family)